MSTPCPMCDGTGTAPERNASNAVKTSCPKGHPYTAENTYRRPNGWRECRTCRANRKERGRGGSAVTVRHYAPGGVR